MQYFVFVIADGAEVATPGEEAAIDVFNERLQTQGHWVYANGPSIDVAVMRLPLDCGADVQLRDATRRSAVVSPATVRNWRVLQLLLERGTPWRDQRGVGGVPFRDYVEAESRGGTADGLAEVLAILRGGEAGRER